MPPFDEKPPVDLPGMDPRRELLTKLLTSFAPSGAGPGGGGGGGDMTAARVGQVPNVQPTTTPTGMPIPGLTMMSPAQAGGPAARTQERPIGDPGREFRSPRARDAAVVSNAVNGLSNMVRQHKQQQFEKEAAMTNEAVSQIIQGSLVQDKLQRGERLSGQDLQQAAAAMHMDPKVLKLFEKAQRDPMSGAYVGIQRAYQGAQARIQAQAEAEKTAAEAQEKRAQALYYEGAAKFQNERGQIERDKLEALETARRNRIIEQAEVKGMKAEFDENGQVKMRGYTQAEIDADPLKKAQQRRELAATDALVERVKQGALRLRNQQEELAFKQKKLSVDSALKSRQLDIMGKKAELPAPARKTISLAMMGEDYIDKMIAIAKAHPEGFGQGGWADNNFKKALGNQEQWAVDFASYAKYAALPMLGIHNSRAASLAKDLDKWNSNMYQTYDSTLARLQDAKTVMKAAQDDTLAAYTKKPSELGSNEPTGSQQEKGAGSGQTGGKGITIGTGADAITIHP